MIRAYEEPIWRFDGPTDRVFMPVTSNGGCPVGCAYCYIPNLGKAAIPLSSEEIAHDITRTEQDERFVAGAIGTLISLGCDSEPFLPENIPGIKRIVEHFGSKNNPVQIATKFVVPDTVLELAIDWPEATPPLVLSTSITTVSQAERIEPGAPSAEDRATNFDKLRPLRWIGAAIIKPISPASLRDTEAFLELFDRHRPEAIVVGAAYQRGRVTQAAEGKTHPLADTWGKRAFNQKEQDFIEAMRKVGSPVFTSSLDVVEWARSRDS